MSEPTPNLRQVLLEVIKLQAHMGEMATQSATRLRVLETSFGAIADKNSELWPLLKASFEENVQQDKKQQAILREQLQATITALEVYING
ncbi:hypothetical protein [Comamonas kerstersii]|uniref:hypothetical protein n=1 Tax=Comamonas kerstersii TaxID=225992 RepID=UPI0026DCAC82|nr:hypothetical protein [Comamonas kerstersii]